VDGSAGRIAAIARKEFIHISRDWRMIVAVLIMPLFQLLLFAYAISFDVRNVPTVVYDQDHSMQSRLYVDAATNSGFFSVVGDVTSNAEVDHAFDRGTARVAIVIARGFGSDLAAGKTGHATVLVDGSEPNSASLGRTYALALNTAFGRGVLSTWAATRGSPIALGSLEPRVRVWFNPERNSADFLVPGLMVVIIMIVTVMQTAVTLVRERDSGTLEQLLVSPLSRSELILGKVIPWAILGFVDTVMITAVSMVVFKVPLRGDVVVLGVGMFLFVLCSLSIGLVISAVAPSIESANMVALLVSFLPGFMLSGMAFPLASIPWALQALSYAFPGRYMVEISRGVFLRGAGWPIMWPQIAELALYAVIALGLATVLNRKRA
jgi:ABC-2 type transport system permease protein